MIVPRPMGLGVGLSTSLTTISLLQLGHCSAVSVSR